MGLKFILTDDRYINLAFGNYHQFIQTAQDDYNPTILDNWIAVDSSIDPAKAQQAVIGYEEYISDTYKIQIEGYYKELQNMLTFENLTSILGLFLLVKMFSVASENTGPNGTGPPVTLPPSVFA